MHVGLYRFAPGFSRAKFGYPTPRVQCYFLTPELVETNGKRILFAKI